MSFLFRSKPKPPAELAASLKAASDVLAMDPASVQGKVREKAMRDASKALTQLKSLFSVDADPSAEVIAELAQEAYFIGLLELMCKTLPLYDFESRKAVVIIFNGLLKRQIGSRLPTVDYISQHPNIIRILLEGYENKEIALNCGMMLRECLKHEQLAQILIDSNQFYKLFDYVEMTTFDIASDAFATFEGFLLQNKMLTAALLVEQFDVIMPKFNKLLASENYVTRRQSLKLLVELLIDPANEDMRSRYLMSSDNLKIVMNLMKDSSKTISTEALRVFRTFLENPTRPKAVHDILLKNQDKLMSFMENFCADTDDEEVHEEKQACLAIVSDLVPRIDDSQEGHQAEVS